MKCKKHQQGGFVLALALLMMLFVGIVVITSSDRTGQETRTAQSQAPTATLQAAAEAGLLTLRQKINKAGASSGICEDEAEEGVEEFCGCIEGASLADLMEGEGGYQGNEMNFSTLSGGQGVDWWFVKDNQEEHFITCFEDEKDNDPRCNDENLVADNSNICRIVANVFVGDQATNPGYFMVGTIDIKEMENDVDKLFNNKKLEELTVDNIKEIFYREDEDGNWILKDSEGIAGYNPDVFDMLELEPGSSLNTDDLRDDRINMFFLKGDLDVELSDSFKNKQVIIISKNESNIDFSVRRGKGSGSGAGAGGIEGWIIAPDGGVYTPSGTPHINMNVNVTTCQTGSHSDRCFGSAGGSGFNGNFSSGDFKNSNDGNGSDDGSTGKVKVDSSEQMQMDFDY